MIADFQLLPVDNNAKNTMLISNGLCIFKSLAILNMNKLRKNQINITHD